MVLPDSRQSDITRKTLATLCTLDIAAGCIFDDQLLKWCSLTGKMRRQAFLLCHHGWVSPVEAEADGLPYIKKLTRLISCGLLCSPDARWDYFPLLPRDDLF